MRYGPQREKTCLRVYANSKGADQPARPRSLISAFVVRVLESVLGLAFSETSKTGFVASRPNYNSITGEPN